MRMEENTQRMRVRRKGEGNDGRRERRVDDRKKNKKNDKREKEGSKSSGRKMGNGKKA